MSIRSVASSALVGEPRSNTKTTRWYETARQAAVPLSPADAVLEHTWAEMRRSRRRWMIGCGLAFVVCLVISYLLGQLHVEALPGSLD